MRAIAAAVVISALAAAPARAQEDPDDFPGGSFFYDAGAIGLVYAPLAVVAAVEIGFDPPRLPRLFSSKEGGVARFANTVPELYVGLAGAALATGIFIPIREGRWFHVKGMAQAVSLTLAITSIGKNVFGRRRPHWTTDSDKVPDTRRSFPSGHSSTSFSIASYACMFLQRKELTLQSGLGCTALLAAAGLTAYSRVRDNRHHKSDVIAGALLGTITSTTMFVLAERRYQTELDEAGTPTSLSLGWGGQF